MFLISDKLDKSDSKYDAMKEDKADLLKEEEGADQPTRRCKCHKWSIIVVFLIMLLFGASVWIMTAHFYKSHELSNAEKEAIKVTNDVINDTQHMLKQIQEKTSTLSEQNKRAATKYVANIRDIVKQRTQYSVQKLNEMILEKVREIENELTTFDNLILGIESGLVDVFNTDVEAEFGRVRPNINAENATDSLDQLIKAVEREMSDMLNEIDQLYARYNGDLAQVLENKATNATTRISMMLTAERTNTKDTDHNRIVMCYDISAKNVLIANQLGALMMVITDLADARTRVNELENTEENEDEDSKQTFDDARSLLAKTEKADREMLDSLVRDESNFLGSLITKESLADDENTRLFVLENFRAVISDLPKYVNQTISDYVVVNAKHLSQIMSQVDDSLAKIGNDLKENAKLINSTTTRDEYIEKANFSKLKSWMQDRFANVSREVNPIFEKRKDKLRDMLDSSTKYIIENQVPYISGASVKNYLPSDLCPASADYQKQIWNTLNATTNNTGSTANADGTQNAKYYTKEFSKEVVTGTGPTATNDGPQKGSFFTKGFLKETEMVSVSTQMGPGNEIETDDGDDTAKSGISNILPPFVLNTINRVINAFRSAGYELQGPVEVYVMKGDE